MKFTKTISRIVNMFTPTKENTSTGVYEFGLNNRLPNQLMEYVLASGVAKKAQQKRSVYIAADGFLKEEAAKLKVNPTQTADQLLAETAGYSAYFEGFVWHVKRNGNSDIAEVRCLPFQDVRKKSDGSISYNPTLSTDKFKKDAEQIIPAFKGLRKLTPDELAEVKDMGEAIYAYVRTADNAQYPIPDYYAGIEDIRTSSELQKFDLETVLNGFITSAQLTIIGDVNDTERGADGLTEKEALDESLARFTGQTKNSYGESGRNRLLVMNAATKDEAPILQPFDSKPIFDASNSKRDLIERSICRLFGVNPVLIGFADAAILGNQQALSNASNELNNDVLGDQALISQTMTMLFPQFEWTISSLRPVNYVPDSILPKLTDDEQRALAGYAPLPSDSNGGEKLLSEKLGVGGTQSLVSVISSVELSAEQKRSALKILFGLSDADAAALVPVEDAAITPTETPEAITNYYLNLVEIQAAITSADISQRYEDYYGYVNMTYRDAEKWNDNDCSKAGGLSRLPLERTKELLNINKSDWNEKHYRWAGQAIGAIIRLKDKLGEDERILNDNNGNACGTKAFISLKNWGYNADKK